MQYIFTCFLKFSFHACYFCICDCHTLGGNLIPYLLDSDIYIRGVTVHKIHGSIRHSGVTVRYVFDTGGGAIGYIAMLEIICLILCKIYAGECLNSVNSL